MTPARRRWRRRAPAISTMRAPRPAPSPLAPFPPSPTTPALSRRAGRRARCAVGSLRGRCGCQRRSGRRQSAAPARAFARRSRGAAHARFRCLIVVAHPDGRELVAEGSCEGRSRRPGAVRVGLRPGLLLSAARPHVRRAERGEGSRQPPRPCGRGAARAVAGIPAWVAASLRVEAAVPAARGPAARLHQLGAGWRSRRRNAPGANRTPDPQLRRLLLYPTELLAPTESGVRRDRHFFPQCVEWSGRADSNGRPPAPKAGALTMLRYAPFGRPLTDARGAFNAAAIRPRVEAGVSPALASGAGVSPAATAALRATCGRDGRLHSFPPVTPPSTLSHVRLRSTADPAPLDLAAPCLLSRGCAFASV